jgi:hypothetical protein
MAERQSAELQGLLQGDHVARKFRSHLKSYNLESRQPSLRERLRRIIPPGRRPSLLSARCICRH